MITKTILSAIGAAGLLIMGAGAVTAATPAEVFNTAWDGSAEAIDDATYAATLENPGMVEGIIAEAFSKATPAQQPDILVAAIRALEQLDVVDCDDIVGLVDYAVALSTEMAGDEVNPDLLAALVDAAMQEADDQCAEGLNLIAVRVTQGGGAAGTGLGSSGAASTGVGATSGSGAGGGSPVFDDLTQEEIEGILDGELGDGDDDDDDDDDDGASGGTPGPPGPPPGTPVE
jgi:hypothetical protein